jgi:hypothetical protein
MQQRISDWVKQFNIVVVPCEERPDRPAGEVVYRLKDLFTTCFGKWDPSGEMGSLPQWARDAYLRPWGAPDYFDDAGGDHNLFARVLNQEGRPLTTQDLVIGWSDGFHLLAQPNFAQYISMTMTPKEKSGWANQPVWNKFYPADGQRGAWCWCPRGASDVVWGGGLPSGHHISTFAVWQAEPRGAAGGNGGNGNGGHIDLEVLRRVAWQAHGLAYGGESAFVRYARAHNLGAALTGELTAGPARLQGFANGIVFSADGSEQAIQHAAW